MRSVSLFAGIGGFDEALRRLGHDVVFANEFEEHAADIYDTHFDRPVDRRDLTTIDAADIPAHDILVGGFPCQAFSVAGQRRGFDETRGTLFFDVARILDHHRPQYLLLENVKGLLSHDRGRTFETIITVLAELGYDCQWQVCNSRDVGVPQNRERVYIAGHRRGLACPQVFPLPPVEAPSPAEASSTAIDANYWKGIDNHGQRTAIVTRPRGLNPGAIREFAPTLTSSRWEQNTALLQTPLTWELDSDPALLDEITMRRLTPLECERLQTFPDGWTARGVQGPIADTNRYRALGNAVTVDVVERVLRRLLPAA